MDYKLVWLGQGGFIFQLGNTSLCVDPYLSDSVKELDGFARILPVPVAPRDLKSEIIICTHDHLDHLDDETIKYTDYQSLTYAGPSSCRQHFLKLQIPENRLQLLNRGDSIKLEDADIFGTYAAHTSDSIGVVVRYSGITIYLVGDSCYDDKLLEAQQYHPDILICCINGKLGNMNHQEAAALARQLGVKTACPCHYGMFLENTADPGDFKQSLSGSGIKYFEFEFNRFVSIAEILI